jgi:hypothetical protein
MKGLIGYGVWGSAGVAIFALVMWGYMGQSLREAAGNALIPLCFCASAGIYGTVSKRASVAAALSVAIPAFVVTVAVKQLLLPLPNGFSWSYALLLGGTAGAIWGCGLPIVARLRREKSVGA